MDEGAFIGGRMYMAGTLPVAQQKFSCLLITTTPGGPDSWIMQQAAKRDESGINPLMPQLLLGDPCKDCKEAGQYMCPHTTETPPFWKSNNNRKAFAFFVCPTPFQNGTDNLNSIGTIKRLMPPKTITPSLTARPSPLRLPSSLLCARAHSGTARKNRRI